MIACFSLFLARKTILNSAATAGAAYPYIFEPTPVFGALAFVPVPVLGVEEVYLYVVVAMLLSPTVSKNGELASNAGSNKEESGSLPSSAAASTRNTSTPSVKSVVAFRFIVSVVDVLGSMGPNPIPPHSIIVPV